MGVSQRQALSERRAAILAAMGVQIWYKRAATSNATASVKAAELDEQAAHNPAADPSESAPALEVKAAIDQTPTQANVVSPKPAVQLIHFGWMKSSHGLLAVPLGLDRTAAVFMREVLAYVDWRAGVTPSTTATGEFRWPQLLDTTEGTPTRALTVFFDKHFGEQRPWVAVSEEVAPDLSEWLQTLPVDMVCIPSVQRALADPSVKQALWQSLQRN